MRRKKQRKRSRLDVVSFLPSARYSRSDHRSGPSYKRDQSDGPFTSVCPYIPPAGNLTQRPADSMQMPLGNSVCASKRDSVRVQADHLFRGWRKSGGAERRGVKGFGVNRHQQRQVDGTMVLNGPRAIRYSNRRVRGCCEVRRRWRRRG